MRLGDLAGAVGRGLFAGAAGTAAMTGVYAATTSVAYALLEG